MAKPKDSGFQRRLRAALHLRGVGVRELERKLGAGNASVSHTLTRRGAKMSLDRVRDVAALLDVRFEWLAWNQGQMDSETPAASSTRQR